MAVATQSWNLEDLRTYVRKSSESQAPLAFIKSLSWCDQIFGYHVREAKTALDALAIEPGTQSAHNHFVVLAPSEEQQQLRVVSYANVVAAIYTVRNAYDHFSQLCNALILGGKIAEHECHLHSLAEKLPSGDLRRTIDEVRDSVGFKYMQAFANRSKHRALIQQGFHLSYVEGRAGIKFDGFAYKGDFYEPRFIEEVLDVVVETGSKMIVCGNHLNELLGIRRSQ